MKTLLCGVSLLLLLGLSGCAQYGGIAIDDGKAYMAKTRMALINSVDVCDIGSDGMLSNCRSAK